MLFRFIALYGSEIKGQTDKTAVEAFEMWCWQRALKIPWMARAMNTEVLVRIGEEMFG